MSMTNPPRRQNLGIRPSDWRCFGKALNGHDLRHAEISDVVPYLQRTEVDNLFGLARGWVAAHLRAGGLSAV